MTGRDVTFERSWLAQAEGRGPDTPFIAGMIERLAAHDEEWGTSYRWASLTELLREVAEEGLDLGGWTALVAESLNGRPELGDRERDRLHPVLVQIAKHGSEAHELALQAQRIVANQSARSAA